MLLDIQFGEVTLFTNGYPCSLRSYGGLGLEFWELCKSPLPIMHYRFEVVRNSQAVDITMATLLEVVPALEGETRQTGLHKDSVD